ncbi:Fatty acid hydroxylase [Sesbania bispinosa]|nr:Fatty acid hydroxylase [Sesbania bispinosa]
MVEHKFVVDLNKPLVFQVGHLGEAYEEWVHQPIISKDGPRFFQNGFLELFTRTAWWVIPVVWVPVASWFISSSAKLGLPSSNLPPLVLLGIFLWTLAEYLLHRFLFHVKTTSYCLRLVFPPAAAAILALPIWNLVKLVSTPSTAPAVFGGILLGYVMYDCTHYYLHHGQPKTEVPQKLKKYHLNHHYRMQNAGFGITSPLWDKVFGTVPPPSKVDSKRR